jgi:hypothetical protein
MAGFEPVTLSWKGEDFTVPADRVFGMIGQIEEIILSGESVPAVLLLLSNRVSQHRLSCAFGAALRYAGASVSDEEIYLSIQDSLANDDMDGAIALQRSVLAILSILSPPFAANLAADDDAEKK